MDPNLGIVRYSFGAVAELTELNSGEYLISEVSELGESGCFVRTTTPLSVGARVSLKIHHNDAQFAALGVVTYCWADHGMGILYEVVLSSDAAVLAAWLSESGGAKDVKLAD